MVQKDYGQLAKEAHAKVAGAVIDASLAAYDAKDRMGRFARKVRNGASDVRWAVVDGVDDAVDAIWEDEGEARLVATAVLVAALAIAVAIPVSLTMARRAARIR